MPRLLSCLPILLALALPLRADDARPLSRIAFGSCARQDKPQPIWDAVVATEPQAFLFIGDNIYGDLKSRPQLDMDALWADWQALGRVPGYRRLKETCPVLATWDDHDFGVNDGGNEYPKKRESQKLFLDFFDEPADSPRRQTEGVYDAKIFGPPGQRTQIILLDTRYFRSPLKPGKRPADKSLGVDGPYVPNDDPDATVLGETQWTWLEEQLRQPAELRIVASSVQVIPNQHRWEKWGNFPRERQRLFDLIRETGASGVVLVSGDRHSAEINRLDDAAPYPLYDVTSSSLNQPSQWHNELGEHRVGSKWYAENFGTIHVDWQARDPEVRLQVRDAEGAVRLHVKTSLSALGGSE